MSLGYYMDIRSRALIGGVNASRDIERITEGVHVAIGTPGRVLDMMHRRYLNFNKIKLVVLDEADELLTRGFHDEIHEIFINLSNGFQTILLASTKTPAVAKIMKKFMRDPVTIVLRKADLSLEDIKHFFVDVKEEKYKLAVLLELYTLIAISQAIIFCKSCRKVDQLTEEMAAKHFAVSAMHGEMDLQEREMLMKQFQSGSSRVLITTDLLARGIDLQEISLVINYDLPSDSENYVQR
jgi:translation initiation factor 4A